MPGRLGARVPMLGTAVGMIYLAYQPPDELEAILARLRRSPEFWNRAPRLWANLDERLAAARRWGYALAHEDYLDSVYQSRIWAVAVPILVENTTVAVLSSLVLRTAGPRRRILSQILPPLRRTASVIAERLLADAGKDAPGAEADLRPRRRSAP